MKTRPIVSLALFLCITILLITSLVLFVEPPGRVAYWTDWQQIFRQVNPLKNAFP